MDMMRITGLTYTTALMLFAGCSTISSTFTSNVEIQTVPSGADVLAISGEKVGTTPMVISDEIKRKLNGPDNRINAILALPGYERREIYIESRGYETMEIRLTKLDDTYFSKRLTEDFSKQTNEVARNLLQIQGLLIAKKFDRAKQLADEFQKRFPNIAASYVLMASIEMAGGDRNKAKAYLLRAKSLDPDDPVVARMLNNEVTKTKDQL